MDLKKIKKAYFVGIKGSGMAAIAEIFQNRGIEISGSDTDEVFYTNDILKRRGISFFEEFDAANVPSDADVVVHSTAYNVENNVEIAEIQKRGIPMVSYPEMLGMLFAEKLGVAVCGTHGKTTTSAMLAEAFIAAEVDPTAVVGSQVIAWQGSAISGNGKYFIAEADEYQNKLRFYDPWSVVLTSIDWDHPDFFPDFASYKDVFKQFVEKISKKGFLIVWGDSSDTLDVAEHADCLVKTYGIGEENEYTVRKIQTGGGGQTFEVCHFDFSLGFFEIPLAGKHNVLNATSVIALCHAMKLDLEKVKKALGEFQGTSRRFEYRGKFKAAIIIDDYAHHPDEVKATLDGARQRFDGKTIWTVFHPHTFTRTRALLQEFSQSFDDTDHVVVIDIYGSAREQQGGVSSNDLVKLINKYNRGKAEYVSTIDEAIGYFKEKSGQYDVLITMGAGDVWKIADKLVDSE